MDDNTVKGSVTEGVGKLKDAAGGLSGDTGLQGEGKIDQLTGKTQREFGDTIDEAQDQLEGVLSVVRDRPMSAIGVAAGAGFLLGMLLIPSRR